MTQEKCCCGQEKTSVLLPINALRLPFCGMGIEVDPEAIKDLAGCSCEGGQPQPGGRVRVTEDLHVYVDGNRAESGDGLSPETAAKSYEDAVKIISGYDGCNSYNVTVHFEDLANEGYYPNIEVYKSHFSTFVRLTFTGHSYLTTRFTEIYLRDSAVLWITEVRVRVVQIQDGYIRLTGNIAVDEHYSGINNNFAVLGGIMSFVNCNVAIYATQCTYLFTSTHNGDMRFSNATMVMQNQLTVSGAFALAMLGGLIFIGGNTSFSGSAIGQKYHSTCSGMIYTGTNNQNVFPGTSAGIVDKGGQYY